jgi:hypothetical protein
MIKLLTGQSIQRFRLRLAVQRGGFVKQCGTAALSGSAAASCGSRGGSVWLDCDPVLTLSKCGKTFWTF